MTASHTNSTYAIITPARNEARNLRRLSECLAAQQLLPRYWIIVDNGSTDETTTVVQRLTSEHSWISLVVSESDRGKTRAEPIVRAFHAGLAKLKEPVEVVVKLDADISMDPTFFSRLASEFERDPSLGIASGSCFEEQIDRTWRQRHGTGSGVWGACRGYRWECLQDVLPLEERMGWDSIDLFKAHVKGWKTAAFLDLPFKHHRTEGSRDGPTAARWAAQGEAARYMGYRFSYLLLRSCYRGLRDPTAFAMLAGYSRSLLRHDPVLRDGQVHAYVRRQQSIRRLPERIREALRSREHLKSDG
jgi:glycosyltransferase involved in cell wall biosynthesis